MQHGTIPGADRALVVDDHEISRHFTVAALRQGDLRVKHCADAGQALQLARDWLPKIIVLDIQLACRDIDGQQLAAEILQIWPGMTERPLLLALTAQPSLLNSTPGSRGLFDHVLRKPLSSKALWTAIGSKHPEHHETCLPEAGGQLRALFHQELQQRLPQLDACMTRLDLAGVAAITHQLTASCALCGAEELRKKMYRLNRSCRREIGNSQLSRDYFSLVSAVRRYLAEANREAMPTPTE